jgi:hypothetical protein
MKHQKIYFMKKILIMMMVSLSLASGVSAQKGRGFYRGHTRIIIAPVIGFSYGGFGYSYPYFNYGFGNPYFVYPYGYGLAPYRPASRLDVQIAAIRSDYRYKIKAARKDKTVPKTERKQNILSLKSEREKAIANAEWNYRQERMKMYHQHQGMNNQNLNYHQEPGNDQSS